jgi:hypothetical protein
MGWKLQILGTWIYSLNINHHLHQHQQTFISKPHRFNTWIVGRCGGADGAADAEKKGGGRIMIYLLKVAIKNRIFI